MLKKTTKQGIILVILLFLLIIFGFLTLCPIHGGIKDIVKQDNAKRFKSERDSLAQLLNSVKQEYGIQTCQMLQLKAKLGQQVNNDVSTSGGWCFKASTSTGGQHVMDTSLADELSLLFAHKTVASFGDGPGDYKKHIDSTKRVALYEAFDGAPFGNVTSGGVIRFLDLTVPQYGIPMYDWVLSLEVAEHIPQKYEFVYIDNVVRHAKEGVVLSWAVPGQGGLAHVNNRPLTYVADLFAERGFQHDFGTSERLQNKSTFVWLQKNIQVFRRKWSHPFMLDEA